MIFLFEFFSYNRHTTYIHTGAEKESAREYSVFNMWFISATRHKFVKCINKRQSVRERLSGIIKLEHIS